MIYFFRNIINTYFLKNHYYYVFAFSAVRSRKGRALNESISEEIETKAMETGNVPRITNIRLRGITKDVKYAGMHATL